MSEYIFGWDGTEIVHDEDRPQPVTELVRCRDCAKAFEGRYFGGTPALVCTRFSTFNHVTEPDDFCSRGVRRE